MPEENQTAQPVDSSPVKNKVENKTGTTTEKTATKPKAKGLISVMQVLRQKASENAIKAVSKLKPTKSVKKEPPEEVGSFAMAGFKDKSTVPNHRTVNLKLKTEKPSTPEASIKKIVSPIRTFEGDVAASIKGGTTMASIAIAKEKRIRSQKGINENTIDDNGQIKKIALAVGAGILILAGIALVGYFFFANFVSDIKQPPIEETIPKLINTNGRKTIEVTALSGKRLLNVFNEEKEKVASSLGDIYQIIPITTDGQSIKTLNSQDFLNSIGARIESSFLRSIGINFLLGIHTFEGNQPVLIFKTDSYDRAFAGMLSWEENMANDLSPLFDISLGTSTSQFDKLIFKDTIVKNRDSRAYFGEDGKIKLLWSIPDRESIIITTNENSLVEAISRLSGSSF